jgi:hypothetical protein
VLNAKCAIGGASGVGDAVGDGVLVGSGVLGALGGLVGCTLTLFAPAVDRATGDELGDAVGVINDGVSVIAAGVETTACTLARGVGAADCLAPSRCRCSARVKTKNGSVIATTSTVAPIE